MNNKSEPQKRSNNRELALGIIVLLAATIIMRILTVVLAEMSDTDAILYRIIFAAIYVLDDVIFASGAAMILYFLMRGLKRSMYLALFFTLFISAIDFASSYMIALALDYSDSDVFFLVNGAYFSGSSLPGEIALFSNIIVLLLNIVLRAVTYLMLILISKHILRGTDSPDAPAPIISRTHPLCRTAAVASVLRMAPYFVYEIYSTVVFLIRNIGSLTGDNILNIFLAYGEIIVDGIITYFAIYIITACMSLMKKPE